MYNNRSELSHRAYLHTMEMESKYEEEIRNSVFKSIISDDKFQPIDFYQTVVFYKKRFDINEPHMEFIVDNIDTVSAIFKYGSICNNIAALNFASFKHPGGQFMKGSNAQEECLCHESFLYNVLKDFDQSYYAKNRNCTDKALYFDRSIYSPEIIFERNGYMQKCDILTCAAPNKKAAQRWFNVSDIQNRTKLMNRISHVIKNFIIHKHYDVIILGAFGCGVFGQNPYEVASIFKETLMFYDDMLIIPTKIVFAVIGDKNFNAFSEVFGGVQKERELE